MILNTLDNLGKFEAKGNEGYFLGYSMSSKAFRVFNKRTKRVKENLQIEFLENKAIEKGSGPNWLFDIDSLTKSMNYVLVVDAGTNSTNFSGTKVDARQDVKKDVSFLRYIVLPNWVHEEHLDGNSNPTATSTNPLADQLEILTVETPIPTVSLPVPTVCFTDSQEPSSETRLISKRDTNQAKTPSLDNILTLSNQFEDILGVTTNSKESSGVEADVSNMEKTITSSPTPTLRIHRDHPKKPKKIFDALQDPSWVEAMQEELLQFKIQKVWSLVDCPKGDPDYPARVYKVEKAMYGLHQAPRAWYDTLSKYLLTNGFQRGTIDRTLFIRRQRGDFILVQVYMDDIIFGSSNPQLCREFEAFMHEKFQMSAMGELNFFLGLQVLQKEDGIFLSQDKYMGDILKKFRYSDVRSLNTPMDKENPWGKDGTGKDVDLHLYRSMIGSLMYLTASRPDIMFAICACARHQVTPKECHLHAIIVATSTTEAEYVAAASCCGQVLWIQNQLLDYGMVAILEKSEHNIDFHPMVDFVEASPLRYALTFKPTIYVSHIRQFWSTARIETTEEETQILATVDGVLRTVTESSIRRNLKL
nr:putative ribonuclease H-like domain-containing protein [Tanacetum cinerariifolium]